MGVKVREKVLGSGVWWVFINHKGKRKSCKVGSKKNAQAVAKEIEHQLALGNFSIDSKVKEVPTFKEYAEKWLTGYAAISLKDSSYRRYRAILRDHIFPDLENKPIDVVTRQDVKDIGFNKIRAGLSSRTATYIIRTVSVIYSHAIEDGIVNHNPASNPGRFIRHDSVADKIDFLTPDELVILLETAKEHFPKLYPLLFAAVMTGMRQGELLGLKWNDIDFQGKFIEVRRSWYSIGNKFTTPKSGKLRRVDMSDQLVSTLANWKKIQSKIAVKTGIRSDLVFPSDTGSPINDGNLRRGFRKVLKKAGLRHIRFHDLRHTYASLLLNLGESPAYIQEQLGHHSIQITVDTYGHLIPGSNRAAVNKLDELIESAPHTHPGKKEGAGESPNPLNSMVAPRRIELRTRGFSVLCSTN
nr:tyrosine-type recombinase/integrase [Candidatus Aenigmarchaeota archaeon]